MKSCWWHDGRVRDVADRPRHSGGVLVTHRLADQQHLSSRHECLLRGHRSAGSQCPGCAFPEARGNHTSPLSGGNNPTSAGDLLKASCVCCGDQVAGCTVCASLSRSLPNQPAERLIDADGEQQFAGREGGERVAEERIRGSSGCRVIGGQ